METFELYKTQIFETLIVLLVVGIINFIFRKWSYRIAQKLHLGLERRRITTKIVNLLLVILATVAIVGIWGVDRKGLLVFLTSTLTVLGIGFFAQWSLLSNVTAGLLLFFNHPLRIGDSIKIIDKDIPVEGVIKDISMFFMHIETIDGENITVPNSLVIQKILSVTTDSTAKSKNDLDVSKSRESDIEDPI